VGFINLASIFSRTYIGDMRKNKKINFLLAFGMSIAMAAITAIRNELQLFSSVVVFFILFFLWCIILNRFLRFPDK